MWITTNSTFIYRLSRMKRSPLGGAFFFFSNLFSFFPTSAYNSNNLKHHNALYCRSYIEGGVNGTCGFCTLAVTRTTVSAGSEVRVGCSYLIDSHWSKLQILRSPQCRRNSGRGSVGTPARQLYNRQGRNQLGIVVSQVR